MIACNICKIYVRGILVEFGRLKQALCTRGRHTSDIDMYTLREGVEFIPKRWTILAEDLPQDITLGK
jgi:hypothetical protein